MFWGFLFMVRICLASDMFEIMEDFDFLRAPAAKLNLVNTYFSSLDGYHVNGKAATDSTYPWIAQVIHSRTRDVPYVCTAVCVHEGVFMTAARCVISLKVKFVSVLYKGKRLPIRAIVVPSKPTSQQFEDIGFLVVDTKGGSYSAATLYAANLVQRKDQAFKWFTTKAFPGAFKAVGYVADKGIHRIKSPDRVYSLKELPIFLGTDLCSTILTNKNLIEGFTVPCYHSCTLADFSKKSKAKSCTGYLGVEGAAVVHATSKKVLGVAVWGPTFHKYELPVGFAVVNSPAFQEDFACAKKIRASNAKSYKGLCK